MSFFYCKCQAFLIQIFIATSLTGLCLATIDQFFVTSQSAYLRRFSNIKWAHRIVLIVIIVCCLHGIPFLLFYNISPITQDLQWRLVLLPLKQREHANRRTQAGRTSWMRKPAAMRPGTPRLSLVIFNPALIPEPACALFLDFAQPTPPLWSIQPFQSVQPLAF